MAHLLHFGTALPVSHESFGFVISFFLLPSYFHIEAAFILVT